MYLMYRQDNREDFCRFKVLKSLVWFVKEFKSSSLQIPRRLFYYNRKSTVYSRISHKKTTVISFHKSLN